MILPLLTPVLWDTVLFLVGRGSLIGANWALTPACLCKGLGRNWELEIVYLSGWMLNVTRATIDSCTGCALHKGSE